MKDAIYAGFAQLSYLNWHILENQEKLFTIFEEEHLFNQIKTPDYNEWDKGNNEYYASLSEEGHKLYAKEDSRIFYLYSEDKEFPKDNPKFSEFGEWEFLCGYDHNKIKEEAGNIIGIFDSGFQGSAFKNGNKVIIAYRGTDEKADWIHTNLDLGMNKYTDQLTCVVYMYEKVKELEPEAEIHITGHSLGGALAQFAFIYSGGKHKTITWNGLGIGEESKILTITSIWINEKILINTLEKLSFIKNDIWQEKCMNITHEQIKEISTIYMEKYNKTLKSYEATPELMNKQLLLEGLEEEKIKKLEIEMKYKLKIIYLFQEHYDKAINNFKIKNIYFTSDVTPNLQKRAGMIVKADEDFEEIEFDNGESDTGRKVKMLVSKSPKSYHTITNFMIFMDDEGNIKQGKINELHMLNVFKTLLSSKNITETDREILLQKGNTNSDLLYELFFKLLDRVAGIIISEDKKLLDNMNFDIEKEIREYKENKKDIFKKDDKYAYLGKFSNLSELGGVTYGGQKSYKLMKEVLREMKDELDVPTYNFFIEYEDKYWLHEKFAPFKYVKLILDPSKPVGERYKIVFIWNLAYKLFITEANEIGKINNKDNREARTTNLNQMKEVFENVIKGYTKESYEAETTEAKAVWSKWGNMDSLLKKLKKQEQPELIKYIESYRETKEKTKEANKKEAEKYEAEQKAMEKQEIKNREKENVKRKIEEHRIRVAEVEAERRGKGWKIANKEDGWGYM